MSKQTIVVRMDGACVKVAGSVSEAVRWLADESGHTQETCIDEAILGCLVDDDGHEWTIRVRA